MSDPILSEQVDYYRARAPEYDQWWNREGRYDKGEEFTRAWRAEVEQAETWLDGFGPTGDVLEIAAGTGNWTRRLLRQADHVTAVDASPETLAINAEKVGPDAPVDHVVADIFDWSPPRRFDHVFFSFWISHVPDAGIVRFMETVAAAMKPGARVAMLDNRGGAPDENNVVEITDGTTDNGTGLSQRLLEDGSTFTIVKVYRSPERLAEMLGPHGWTLTGGSTERYFTWAEATRN
jgi:demethylmenaquinone methyltransferase/2-methoxy-6-polyprenyl-1,4-benzoquinol methylase